MKTTGTVLCFDCSTIQASVSLFVNGACLKEFVSVAQRSHSEFITSALEQLLRLAGKKTSDIDLILLANGPGSFTGIRVAVGLAKALSYANNCPLWAVDSLTLLRSQAPLKTACFSSLNAYKNLVFGSYFSAGSLSAVPQVFTFAGARELLTLKSKDQKICVVGDGFSLFKDSLDPMVCSQLVLESGFEAHPKSSWLFALHQSSPEIGQTIDWKFLNPLYIRGSEAEENLRK